MKQEEFELLFTSWKEQLVIDCDNLAKNPNYELDPDFCPFRSAVRPNPPLLIMGANPGDAGTYSSLFSTDKLRPVLEQAVITNLVYFNTNNFNDFESRKGAEEAIEFCIYSNRRLLRILRPENILLLGNRASRYLSPYFDKPMEDILSTRDGKTALIRKTTIDGTPTYWMCHPSSGREFWSGEHIIMKSACMETVF